MLTLTVEGLLRLASLATGGTPTALAECKIHLVKVDFDASPRTLLADLVEADYGGYTVPVTLVWDTPILEPDGSVTVQAAEHEFLGDGTGAPNTIFGWYLSIPPVVGPPAVAEQLLAVERVATPFALGAADSGRRVAALLQLA